jgi:hypothetical protein
MANSVSAARFDAKARDETWSPKKSESGLDRPPWRRQKGSNIAV